MNNQINTILDLIKHKNLGRAFTDMEKLYHSNPKNYDYAKLYGYLLMQKRDFIHSEKIFKSLSGPNNNDYDIFNNLGHIYVEIEKFLEAEQNLIKAIDLLPDEISAYANLGALYLKVGEYEKALKNYKIYFEIIGGEEKYELEDQTIIVGYLDTLVAIGHKDDAKNKIKIFLEKKFNEDVFYYLVNLERNYGTPEEFDNLIKQYSSYKDKSFLENNKKYAAILFSGALYYEKRNQELSEKYYYEGNKVVSNLQRFRPLEFQNKIKAIKKSYNNFFKNLDTSNDPRKGDGLIFIVGLPRSGTTLVESIIANHQSVKSGGELKSMMMLCSEFIKDEKNLDITHEQINNIGDEYLARINFIKKNSKFFIDKLPGNYFNIGYIDACLPGSKFILVKRNIWDVATSQFKQYYINNVPYSSKFFNIAIECANFEELLNFWKSNISSFENKIMTVEYEALVKNEEEWANRIYQFIGIEGPYSSTNRESFFSRTASRFQIQNKIHQSSVQKSFFLDSQDQFFEDYKTQREYWSKS